MAAEYKDYYKSLGVSRTATEDEIRKAFRKLARQYHPDVAKDKKNAEEKFKEINEAYEVLSDPEKRKKYDTLGADWNSAGRSFRPPPGGGRANGRQTWQGAPGGAGGFEFEFDGTTGFSDFFEQLFGSRGGGRTRGANSRSDFSQRGQDVEAEILVSLEEASQGATRPISLRRADLCDQCHGEGEIKGKTCQTCGGSGQVERQETFQIRIPAGVREGQRLRVAGRGEGSPGSMGDLFLNVRFARHPDFRVEEGRLIHDLPLAPWEAVLGAQVSVPTLDGRVSIKIPPGSQSGQQLRVRGRGLAQEGGARGDLLVTLRVETPANISGAERALWEKLAKESEFKPRE
ncbi:MAG TPA: DnaJ C-terminal domain-containing protein [Verrucomicrobiae bacterium]|nr:DnaJ C-terminal domain-containing protein [Verrucomicrobiae bacterium]